MTSRVIGVTCLARALLPWSVGVQEAPVGLHLGVGTRYVAAHSVRGLAPVGGVSPDDVREPPESADAVCPGVVSSGGPWVTTVGGRGLTDLGGVGRGTAPGRGPRVVAAVHGEVAGRSVQRPVGGRSHARVAVPIHWGQVLRETRT